MPSILLIDDETEILEFTKFALEAQGYEVFTATSGKEALQVFKEKRPQLLLIDYRLDGTMTGLDFLKEVRASDSVVPAVMITGLTDTVDALKAECEKLGKTRLLQKPLQMETVYEAVRQALDPSGNTG